MKRLLLVAYYRVSTRKQARSGLGLDAQRAAVGAYARRAGATIVAEYAEAESGRCRRRPELAAAIARARQAGATLVVAKLDRLARDTTFLLSVLDGGTSVEFLDFPEAAGIAGRLIVTVMAAVAEFESRRIGERVSSAAAARRERGGPKYRRYVARLRGILRQAVAARRRSAAEWRARMRPVIRRYRDQGRTWAWIAGKLNEDRVPTWSGGRWRLANVHRLMVARPWE